MENKEAQEKVQDKEREITKFELKLEFFKLTIQRFLGLIAIIPLTGTIVLIFKYRLKYKIRDIKEVRRQYRELTKENLPILVCPNHLTMIDSVVLMWATGSVFWFQFHFGKFFWNVAARENFQKTCWRAFITYLGKCIPIDRDGSKKHHDLILQKTIYLLNKKETFLYFPEGGRSRVKRIDLDNIRYGVGKLLAELPQTKVICVYMRGDGQEEYSFIPQKYEVFSVKMRAVYPQSKHKGLRAHRDLSYQIMNTLKEMEDEYFEEHPGLGE